jgi:predicted ArsR family transcriptional regulator
MTATPEIRSVDRELLVAMRSGEAFGVGELTQSLGVTATAIRQRIERLLEHGWIEREKVVAGRGRPTFQYRITLSGHQAAGANPSELAGAMWQAILDVDDPAIRSAMLRSVASKLGRQYADALANCEEDSLQVRLQKLSSALSAQLIASTVSGSGDLPVLDITACPYPSLTAASEDRAMCKLEEQMLSEALGSPVHLSSCRLDGDSCCQFSAGENP